MELVRSAEVDVDLNRSPKLHSINLHYNFALSDTNDSWTLLFDCFKDFERYHEFHETSHSVTLIVLVNSHQR